MLKVWSFIWQWIGNLLRIKALWQLLPSGVAAVLTGYFTWIAHQPVWIIVLASSLAGVAALIIARYFQLPPKAVALPPNQTTHGPQSPINTARRDIHQHFYAAPPSSPPETELDNDEAQRSSPTLTKSTVANLGGLQFDGCALDYDDLYGYAMLPPFGNQRWGVVHVKNTLTDTATTLHNVRAKIEYLYNGTYELQINNALWLNGVSSLDLDADAYSFFAVFMISEAMTDVQSARTQDDNNIRCYRLRPGRWKAVITVSADFQEPLYGEVEFTIIAGAFRTFRVECQPPYGATRLPTECAPSFERDRR